MEGLSIVSVCSTRTRIDESRELARDLLWIRALRLLRELNAKLERQILELRRARIEVQVANLRAKG